MYSDIFYETKEGFKRDRKYSSWIMKGKIDKTAGIIIQLTIWLNERRGPNASGYFTGPGRSYPAGDTESAEKRAAFRRGDHPAFFSVGSFHFPPPVGSEGGGPDSGPAGGKIHLLPAERFCAGGDPALDYRPERG